LVTLGEGKKSTRIVCEECNPLKSFFKRIFKAIWYSTVPAATSDKSFGSRVNAALASTAASADLELESFSRWATLSAAASLSNLSKSTFLSCSSGG